MKKAKRGLVKNAAFLALVFSAGAIMASCGQNQPQSSSSVSSSVPAEKVKWEGVADLNLDMGDAAPNLILGVTAKQGDKVLTIKIDEERSDEVDTSVAGAFSIYYIAYDGSTPVGEALNGEYIRTVNVSRGTYIDNNKFETANKKGWGGNGNGNSEMSWDIDTTQKALVVNIVKSGDEYWQNQVEFNGLEVKANTTYVVDIRAKSDTPRNIGATMEVPALSYRCIDSVSVNSVGYTLTNQYASYKFYYTASENYEGVKFGILMGRFNQLDDSANKIYIDSVSITKAEKQANSTGIVFTGESSVEVSSLEEYQALAPVTAKDASGNAVTLTKEGAVQSVAYPEELGKGTFGEMWKYVDASGNLSYFRRQINYKAPAPERTGVYDALDGDFEYGMKFWTPEENDIVHIEANKADKTVVVNSVKAAPSQEADWRAQIQQNNNGGKLEKDHAYKMVVEAKIDNINVTTLRAEFCAGAGNPNAKKDMVFTAADTYQTFETEVFQPTEDVTGGAYRVGLLIGEYSAAYTLTVKSIHVVEVEAETPYVRENVYEVMDGTFQKGLKYWVKEENGIVSIAANDDHTVTINSVKEAPSQEADWRAQLQQNNNGGKLEAGKSYIATVTAKCNNTSVNTLRLEFCAGAGNPNAKKDMVFTTADTYQTFQTEIFTPAEDVTGGAYRIGLLIGEYNAAYSLTVSSITIQEVSNS